MPQGATAATPATNTTNPPVDHPKRGLTHAGIDEAASILGIRPPAVRARIKAGKLPAVRVSAPNGGYVWMIDRADLGHAPFIEPVGLLDEAAPAAAPAATITAAPGAAPGAAIAPASDEVLHLRKLVEELQAEKIRLEEASRDRDRDRAREVQELHGLLANSQRLLAATGLVESSSRPRSGWRLLNPLNWFS
ncbi:MAG: helix-turn-helix domain-containing protein [Chloroflexi bacterium]|nr:helix-turn-helix domain-containing protein [Chloroflexota bacterium]